METFRRRLDENDRGERRWRNTCGGVMCMLVEPWWTIFQLETARVLSPRSFLPSARRRRGRNLGSERDKRWPWPMEIVFLVFSAGPTNLLGAGNKPRLNGINAWQSRALPTFDTPPPPPPPPSTAFEPRNRSIRTVVLLPFFLFPPLMDETELPSSMHDSASTRCNDSDRIR